MHRASRSLFACGSWLLLLVIPVLSIFEQATIAERANAFRHQYEMAETIKLKEINLYALTYFLLTMSDILLVRGTIELISRRCDFRFAVISLC